jgi:hypothetical protein
MRMNKDNKHNTEIEVQVDEREEEMLTAEELGVAVVQSNAESVLRPVRHIRRVVA